MVVKPKQRISQASKNAEWVKENCLYYRQEAKPIVDEKRVNIRYNVAYGVMNEEDYLYVTNPRNTTREELKGYPSKLRNIPIGPPIMAVLMGEKTKRFIDYQVIAINSDIENVKIAKETELVLNAMKEDFYDQLAAKQFGRNGEENPSLVRTPQQIKQEVNDIVDEIAIQGQDGIDYIRFYNDLDRKFKELFHDVLCQNCYVCERTIVNDEVVFNVISVKEISVVGGRNNTFIEDCEAVVRKTRMFTNELYDAFQDFDNFEKDLLPLINSYSGGNDNNSGAPLRRHGFSEIDLKFTNFNSTGAAAELFSNLGLNRKMEAFENSDMFDVEHIVWDSYVKVGLLETFNPMTGFETIEVNEKYVPVEGDNIKWEWRKETWHAYLIDEEIVMGGEALAVTKAPSNAPNKSKKPYNGRILDGIPVSEIILPYQAKHNVLNYYAEKLIGKHRGDIILFPISLMPDGSNEAGIDMETSIHYADADGLLLIDDSDKDKLQALQYMKILNSSLDSTLGQIITYMNNNKAELEEIIGINRFRKGQNNSSDGKFVSQQAEYRGSMMSEHLFVQVDEAHVKDLQYMLDLSQIAWVKGKKSHFLSSERRNKFLEITNPERYSTIEFGVGINNSARGTEKLNLMKQYTQALAQDPNVPKNVIPRIIDADNMATLIREMDLLMADFEAKQQNASEQERIMELEKRKTELDKLEQTLNFQYFKTNRDNQTKVEVKDMEIEANKRAQEQLNTTQVNPDAERERQVKLTIANRQMALDKELAQLKASVDRYKADTSLKAAKIPRPTTK